MGKRNMISGEKTLSKDWTKSVLQTQRVVLHEGGTVQRKSLLQEKGRRPVRERTALCETGKTGIKRERLFLLPRLRLIFNLGMSLSGGIPNNGSGKKRKFFFLMEGPPLGGGG